MFFIDEYLIPFDLNAFTDQHQPGVTEQPTVCGFVVPVSQRGLQTAAVL